MPYMERKSAGGGLGGKESKNRQKIDGGGFIA